MLKVLCIFCVSLVVVPPIEAAVRSLPPYIQACRVSDPDINKCIVDNGNDAIPKLKDGDKTFKLPPSNPLRINEAVLEPGANLRLAMKDIDVIGLDTMRIKDAKFNIKEHNIHMNIEIPQINLLGEYEINGRILILPIVGKGGANITCDNMHITYDLNFKEEVKKGINQFQFINNTVDYTSTRIYYHFDNLFNGDKRLVAEMSKFLDENWKEIDKELHQSFNEIISSVIQSFIVPIAQGIPYDSIFLP